MTMKKIKFASCVKLLAQHRFATKVIQKGEKASAYKTTIINKISTNIMSRIVLKPISHENRRKARNSIAVDDLPLLFLCQNCFIPNQRHPLRADASPPTVRVGFEC